MKYIRLALLKATAPVSESGIVYYLGMLLVSYVRLFLLLYIWQGILGDKPGVLSLSQAQTYTFLSCVLGPLLNVETPTANLFGDGSLLSNSLRPMPVISQLIAETVGGWLLRLALVSLPAVFIAPYFGVVWEGLFTARTAYFIISLALAVTLGFAVDFLYSALAIHLKYATYMVHLIRGGIAALLSGAVIPLAAFPYPVSEIFGYLPFASMAGAPLSIYTGIQPAVPVILLQLFWSVALWPLAIICFRRSQERMVGYGG